jgi:hypothetical protein
MEHRSAFICSEGFTEVVALSLLAIVGLQKSQLLFGLHPFTHYP